MTLRARDVGLSFAHPGTHPDHAPTRALEGISFDVAPGEVLGIAGSSGAGKSLIAAALAGILPPAALLDGGITLNGTPPSPRDIALAPQRLDALDPLATLGRQIRRLGGRRTDPAALLARVGLTARVARAYPHSLSGGMARRALLATALAGGAAWVVVDEPTVGLDPEAADRVMALLRALAEEGRGLVVISHDLPRLARIATRVLVLQDGRAVETAPAAAFAGDGTGLATAFARRLWQAQIEDPAC
ncbi:ABC transporter ATP-binding protein [Mesobaculum littorinae]|uniref:ABC transporter ATP-binding protein n=1 Tax=Mesobaculum littorinae TaxID=2486419 RepID=A0A438AES5_9RHOB|nr:ATP-binding cassette domain-containing protein [Mesobaculum littorinae]RVV97203.1 ABC transporter ATP-binding protein [Mesobaculum littorinae]